MKDRRDVSVWLPDWAGGALDSRLGPKKPVVPAMVEDVALNAVAAPPSTLELNAFGPIDWPVKTKPDVKYCNTVRLVCPVARLQVVWHEIGALAANVPPVPVKVMVLGVQASVRVSVSVTLSVIGCGPLVIVAAAAAGDQTRLRVATAKTAIIDAMRFILAPFKWCAAVRNLRVGPTRL